MGLNLVPEIERRFGAFGFFLGAEFFAGRLEAVLRCEGEMVGTAIRLGWL